MKTVTARAGINIALIKYWGKAPGPGNKPAGPSLSLTLAELHSTTTVEPIEGPDDRILLDDRELTRQDAARLFDFITLFRSRARSTDAVKVTSHNNFPTGGGLASSASGLAALTIALAECFELKEDRRELSVLARRGSGSAARSIFGGLVEIVANTHEPYARPVDESPALPLRMLVCEAHSGPKEVPSREGMNHTMQTSPFYQAWLKTVERDLEELREAWRAGDFTRVGEITEANALAMHASAIAARPGILYWNGTTINLLREIELCRRDGLPVWATIDAGPHVVALTLEPSVPALTQRLAQVSGVVKITACSPGPGACILNS